MASEIGQQVGRFTLREPLAVGAFATVYRADDSASGTPVALKLLHPQLCADQALVQRFRTQAALATSVHHPHLVPVHEAGETADGSLYLIMELLDGQNLAAMLAQRGPLAFDDVVNLATQLASALDYLHDSQIVHRDLKPSNVMVNDGGQITLMDFGIARILDEEPITEPGMVVGTVMYMAPEQVKGTPVSSATDIYALGILTYEICAGRPPFKGSTYAVMRDQVESAPPPIVQFNPSVPQSVAEAIERALAKEPAARPATAAAFVGQLRDDTAAAQVDE